MRLMEESLGADIELDAVARGAGLSRPHFYKLFRTQTGLTPNLYVNTLLMEQAIDRLVGSEIPVADIGYDLGFSSQSGFTALLRRQCGHGADAIPPGRPCPLASLPVLWGGSAATPLQLRDELRAYGRDEPRPARP